MKKLFKIIVFIIILIVLWNGIENVVIIKNRNQNNTSNSEAENADVIFIGTSQSALGINPVTMWDEQGIRAYNFSGNGQYIGITYYALQDILNNFNPKVIALDIRSVVIPKDFLTKGNLSYNFTVISNPILRYQMYTDIIEEDFVYYLPLLRWHERWKVATSSDYQKKPQYVLGAELYANFKPKITEIPQIPTIEERDVIGEVELDYFEKIVSLAKEKGCKVLFLRLPGKCDSKIEAKVQDIINWGNERGIALCDMMSAQFYEETKLALDDFWDAKHLNVNGADKASKWLAEYMIDNGYAEDKRQDSDAGEWESKVVESRKALHDLYLQSQDNFEEFYNLLEGKTEYCTAFVVSGEVSEETLRKVDEVCEINLTESGEKVFILSKGRLTAGRESDIYYRQNCYKLSGKNDLFISEVSGEISMDNQSIKVVDNGINVVVYNVQEEELVCTAGFDMELMRFE